MATGRRGVRQAGKAGHYPYGAAKMQACVDGREHDVFSLVWVHGKQVFVKSRSVAYALAEHVRLHV